MSAILPSVRVAMGDDFLLAFSRLPKTAQKKAREFVEKFRSNPTSPGLNYEKIHASTDPNLRSLRLHQDYRAIVLKPDEGNTYILLWVDKHDDAYTWAQDRVCSIHPTTGVIQVLENQSIAPPQLVPEEPVSRPAETKKRANLPGIFDPYTNDELSEIGVPESVIAIVRDIRAESELDQIESKLPTDAFEALFYLAISGSIEETKREVGIETPLKVDQNDFSAALDRAGAKRKFVVLSDSDEMEKILSYPLDRWRTFLHPSQRRIVEMNANGPVRVLGGAGTGKTVVAIHRAKWLAEHVCSKSERVLFTTFTKNLAADIMQNLRKICSHETLQKIEVRNLDAWASRLMSGRGKKNRRIDFEGKQTRELWEEALTFSPADCPLDENEIESEWKYVIQAHGIRQEQDYIRASRIGMGKPLNRVKRKELWPVFEECIALQKEAGICEPIDALRMARELIETQNVMLDYRAVVVDEAQDFSIEAFKLVNAIVPQIRAENGNNLFIVGDAHQRLYGHKVILSHCGINIRGRSRKLRINYRTSEETKKWATSILQECAVDDLDGGLDDQKGYRSLFHGEHPIIEACGNDEEQVDVIQAHISNLVEQGAQPETICVVARTNRLCDSLGKALSEKGHITHKVSAGESEGGQKEGLRIATMHRVKGIEFDHMILSHMEAQCWGNHSGPTIEDRCLIYVAATRARKSVLVTSAGEMLSGLKRSLDSSHSERGPVS